MSGHVQSCAHTLGKVLLEDDRYSDYRMSTQTEATQRWTLQSSKLDQTYQFSSWYKNIIRSAVRSTIPLPLSTVCQVYPLHTSLVLLYIEHADNSNT